MVVRLNFFNNKGLAQDFSVLSPVSTALQYHIFQKQILQKSTTTWHMQWNLLLRKLLSRSSYRLVLWKTDNRTTIKLRPVSKMYQNIDLSNQLWWIMVTTMGLNKWGGQVGLAYPLGVPYCMSWIFHSLSEWLRNVARAISTVSGALFEIEKTRVPQWKTWMRPTFEYWRAATIDIADN